MSDPMTPPDGPDPAAALLSDSMTEFGRDEATGRVRIRRRPFGESLRILLDVPADMADEDVLAELAVRRHEAGRAPAGTNPNRDISRTCDSCGQTNWSPCLSDCPDFVPTAPDVIDWEDLVDIIDMYLLRDERADAERVADALCQPRNRDLLARLSLARGLDCRPAPSRPGDFRACFECGHVWRTREEWLADVERGCREAGVPIDPELPFCPLCTHDL